MYLTLSTVVAFIVAALLPLTQANFDVYRVELRSPFGVSVYWQVFEAEGNCAGTGLDSKLWYSSSDVSGGKIGVRCKGNGCQAQTPAAEIEQLEMHFSNNPKYHWTIYSNRGRSMFGLDGKIYGNCIVFPNGDFNCDKPPGKWQGRRKFRCLTRFTANDLKNAK